VAGLKLVDIGSANETIKKREYRRELEILTKKGRGLSKKRVNSEKKYMKNENNTSKIF